MVLIRIVGIIIVAAIIGVLLFFFSNAESETINAYEIRGYVTIFLLMCTLTTFGILRLYNAVVRNTQQLQSVSYGLRQFKNSLKKISNDLENQRTRLASNLRSFLSGLDSLVKLMTNSKRKQ